MTVEYFVTEDDFINYQLHFAKRSPTMQRQLKLQRYGFACVFVLFGLLMTLVSTMPDIIWIMTYTAAAVAWIIYYPHYFQRYLKKLSRKLLREKKNSGMLGQQTLTITPNELIGIDETGRSVLSWSAIEEVEMTESYLYIHIGSLRAAVIPVTAFSTLAECRAFYDEAARYYRAAKG